MSRYFANATEGDAWTSVWCDTCTHDHGMHTGSGDGCAILLELLTDPDGEPAQITHREGPPFILPPDVICHAYEPCTLGDCTGDPQPAARAAARARVAEAAVVIIHHERTGE